MKFSKKDYIKAIKEIEIDDGDIIKHKDSGKIEINIVGTQMQKSANQISLKSIYDLVVGIKNDVDILKQDIKTIDKRLDAIEQDIVHLKRDVKEIKQDIVLLKSDVKELKSLPTIAKELEHNQLL